MLIDIDSDEASRLCSARRWPWENLRLPCAKGFYPFRGFTERELVVC